MAFISQPVENYQAQTMAVRDEDTSPLLIKVTSDDVTANGKSLDSVKLRQIITRLTRHEASGVAEAMTQRKHNLEEIATRKGKESEAERPGTENLR